MRMQYNSMRMQHSVRMQYDSIDDSYDAEWVRSRKKNICFVSKQRLLSL